MPPSPPFTGFPKKQPLDVLGCPRRSSRLEDFLFQLANWFDALLVLNSFVEMCPLVQLRLGDFSQHIRDTLWEPKTFIFGGYNPYFGGVKPSFFMGTWGPKAYGFR